MLLFIIIVFAIGFLYFICGFGMYALIGTDFSKSGVVSVALCVMLGFALLGWTGIWVFHNNLSPVLSVWIALVISLSTIIISAYLRKNNPFNLFSSLIVRCCRNYDLILALSIFILIVFNSGYKNGFNQPFRLGIDSVGYALSGEYLAQGGTRQSIQNDVILATEQLTLVDGLNAHLTMLNFRSSIAAEFLLKAQRYGYPMVLASIANFFKFKSIVEYQFIFLAVPLFSAAIFIYWFCVELLFLPQLISKIISIALLLNCNQLIVLYEGQHAQIAVLPYFVLFFGLFYKIRFNYASFSEITKLSNCWLVMIVGAGIFEFYSDSLIALLLFGFIVGLFDLIFCKKEVLFKTLIFGTLIFFGMLVLGEYFVDWIGFMIRHLRNLGAGNGGFWQPHWAYPSEILGYKSIYDRVVPSLLDRSFFSDFMGATLSLLIFLVALSSPFAIKRENLIYWISPVLVCFFVYVRSALFNNYINYGYYKTYTILLVPLILFHFGSLYYWIKKLFGRYALGNVLVFMSVAISITLLVGLSDSFAYSRDVKYAPLGSSELRAYSKKHQLSQNAILTVPSGGIDLALLGGYFDFNWLNLGWSDIRLRPCLNKEILVLALKDSGTDFAMLNRSSRVLFSSGDILLLRTGRTIRDFIKFDIDIIGNSPTREMATPKIQASIYSEFISNYLREVQLEVTNKPS